MGEGVKVARVAMLEHLRDLDTRTKVAFVGDVDLDFKSKEAANESCFKRMYLRHSDVWTNRSDGGFVASVGPLVSRLAILGPRVIVSGDVEIWGHVVIDGDRTIDGGEKGVVVETKALTPQEIMEIAKLRR
jgi:hypothetical protein